MVNDTIYSKTDANKAQEMNNDSLLLHLPENKSIIKTMQEPYIGQNGPYKNPRFTNLPASMEQYIDSYNQPI
jgi:hypothetical protein